MDLALAAPPPPAGLAEQSPSSMCRWMSRIAFLMEDSLQLRQSTRCPLSSFPNPLLPTPWMLTSYFYSSESMLAL